MWEEEADIYLLGLVHSADEWLDFACNLCRAGQSGFATMIYHSLHQYAKETGNIQLQERCVAGFENVSIPQAFFYKSEGATDPNNRRRMKWSRNPDVNIFDEKLDEGEIVEALQKIIFNDLKDRRYWFVVHRVFKELNWLCVKMDTKFADWVNFYFNWPWERGKPWRTVEKEIRNTDSWLWNENTVEENDIGKHYAALAKILWSTFTEKPKRNKNDKPIDKVLFYLPNRILINKG